ncbi:MAG: hypothetical protein HC905_25270 [Bacteroidales bacterium]|nr:hypothetical protein [Bacteroidales bacterium]
MKIIWKIANSILIILSEVYRKENEAIRTGEQPHLGPLVMAGGWIESFYLLNKLYDKTRNSNLFGIVLQQQYVLENLIAILKPYYKKSPDYTELIDQLVNISYEFEVIDMNYKNSPAINKENTTYVKCKFTPLLTGSHLEEIGEMSGSLRNIIIF